MKKKKEFLKTAIVINKLELDATTENANNKTEQIIRDIIDPTPGLFVDDTFNSDNQNRNNSDRIFTLPIKLNKRLDNILKENRLPEIFELKPIEKILNDPINIQEPDDTFINTGKVIQDAPKFELQVNFMQLNLDDFKIYPDNEDAIIFKSPTLTVVKNKASGFVSYKITREQ